MTDKRPPGCAGKAIGLILGSLFAGVWVLGWSAVTLTFDAIWAKAAVAQWRAMSYPAVQGTVLSSRVQERSDSESTTHTPQVRYSYEVAGRRYECERLRHGMTGSGRKRSAAVVAAHPPGSTVTVYYHPADPSEAVLRPGLVAGDLFMPLFMTPFNLVMLASWLFVGVALTRPLRAPPPAGVKVWHEGMNLRLRPEGFPPLGAAAIAAALAAVPGILIAGIAGGPDAPAIFVCACWALVLAASVYMYLRVARPQRAGHLDLVIDPWRKTITLPRTHGRTEAVQVAFAAVTGVDVEHQTSTDSEGDVRHHYLPTLHWNDREHVERSAILAKWGDEDRAGRLAKWLRERLGV